MKRFPLVVTRAQKLAHTNPELKKLLKQSLQKLSELDNTEKLSYVYAKIDELLAAEDLSKATCAKGCHFCCYHPIEVSTLEKKNLRPKIKHADKKRLNYQVNQLLNENIYDDWQYSEQACVFLDKSGGCKVYEDRPIICRLTYVLSIADNCHYDNEDQQINHHPVYTAAILALAFLMGEEDGHLLPLALI
jgi:Fe-S-cluster containining protein